MRLKEFITLSVIIFILFFSKILLGQAFDNSYPTKKIEYFPNSINSFWKYERHDKIKDEIDTVTIKIIGDTLILNRLFRIWEYKLKNSKEFYFYSTDKDSIRIINPISMGLIQLFLIPFELNRSWVVYQDVNILSHNNSVFSVMEIKTNKTQEPESELFLIKHQKYGRNVYFTEIIWFKPYQGILRLEKKHWGRVQSIDESWELIESNVK